MLLFNRYEYNPQTDLIGKGGFSRVYKALDKKLNRWLALKVYKMSELADRYSAVAEIQRVINLDHPNICRYIDIEEIEKEDSFGDKDMIQVCVMELLDGGDFASYYHKHGNDNEILKKLLQDVIRGLSYLHKNGVIHRDIKPANILIKETVEGPVAKITDFGISKRSDSTDNSSSSALIVSIPYMAPEQFNAKKYGINDKISYNIDFWSLGVAVYETITGDILFKTDASDSREQIMNNIMSPELPEKIKNLPQPFMTFVSSCIIKDAKERVQHAEDLLNILQSTGDDYAYEDEPEEDSDITETSTLIIQRPEDASDETQILTRTKRENVEFKEPKKEIPSVPKAPVKDEQMSLFNRYDYNPHSGLIGKGGFSRVYKAFDNKLSRWVALKIYKPGEFLEHYSPIAEIRRVVNLDHSNICRYLDMEEIEKENSFGEKEKTQVCVMELLDGGNFSQYYKKNSDQEVLKKLLNDVLNGLSYLHKNGIIHRDIKPANILIKETMDGPVAKITDFGISKRSDAVSVNTSSALIVSIPYMAPEQLNTKKYGINDKITFNLDLWSLGVTIYEVITGKILFKTTDQDSPEQIMANIMAPELPEKINELPQPFRNIVSHCVVKDAKDRAQKAEELIVLLHGNFSEEPVVVPATENISSTSNTEKISKTSFYIEKPKEEKIPATRTVSGVKTKSEKLIIFLRIAVTAAALMIAVIIYLFTRENKKAEIVVAPDKKTDSVKTISSPSTVTQNPKQPENPAQSGTQASSTEKSVPPPSQLPSTNENADAASEKKSKKASETVKDRKHEEQTSRPNKNEKYILELSTNETCTVKINNDDYGTLSPGNPMKVYLLAGKYILQATGTDSKKTFAGNLEVTQENLSEVGQYKIVLK